MVYSTSLIQNLLFTTEQQSPRILPPLQPDPYDLLFLIHAQFFLRPSHLFHPLFLFFPFQNIPASFPRSCSTSTLPLALYKIGILPRFLPLISSFVFVLNSHPRLAQTKAPGLLVPAPDMPPAGIHSATLIVSAQVGRHVRGRVAGVRVDAPCGGIPVRVWRGKEARGGDGEGLGVWGSHKVHLLLVRVVGAHVGQV